MGAARTSTPSERMNGSYGRTFGPDSSHALSVRSGDCRQTMRARKLRPLLSFVLFFFLAACTAVPTVLPTTSPIAATPTPSVAAVCPVTLPLPATEVPVSAASVILAGQSGGVGKPPPMYGRGSLWVVIPRDGIVRGLEEKFPTVRLESGPLTAEIRRLDGPMPTPPVITIPDGYGASGFQAFAVEFPTAGCWEITQRLDDNQIRFVVAVRPTSP